LILKRTKIQQQKLISKMPVNQPKSRGFVIVNDASILSPSFVDLENSLDNTKKNKLVRMKGRVGVSTPRASVTNEILFSVDNEAIHKYNANIYHLKKITNTKLSEIADPGANRDYLTKITVYACFLKVGEIGINKRDLIMFLSIIIVLKFGKLKKNIFH
jgi:hypothetical protein